jgi:hypothetical protein
MLHSLFGRILGCHLRGKRGALTGALKTLCASAGPGDHIPLWIGNGNDRIVEGRLDVSNSNLNIFLNLLFLYSLPLGHNASLINVICSSCLRAEVASARRRESCLVTNTYSFSFFFPMMARRGPFRVLALVWVL